MKSADGCAPRCAQVLLIVFNVLFFASGVALVGIGAWILADSSTLPLMDFFAEMGGSGALLRMAAIVMIAIGIFVLIVGFFGCCGAIKLSKVLLTVYIVMLCIVVVGEVTAGIMGIVFKEKIISYANKTFKSEVDKKWGTNNGENAFQQAVNYIQYTKQCCGWSDIATDYSSLIRKSQIPVTCCYLKSSNLIVNDIVDSDANNYAKCNQGDVRYRITKTCQADLNDFIQENSLYMIGLGIGLACLQLFGVIFASCLCKNPGAH